MDVILAAHAKTLAALGRKMATMVPEGVKDHAINVDPPGELLPGQWLNSSNVLPAKTLQLAGMLMLICV